MASRPTFFDQQYAFAAHIRDPQKAPAPADVEDRRMAIYRELFFNNAVKLLRSTFPVLAKILGDERWKSLIRDYYSRHICHTPLFLQVPGELIEYLQTEYKPIENDPPFMLELAHYEWMELALAIAEESVDDVDANPEGDLLSGIPVVSPVAWSLAYEFDVHHISPDYQPDKPGETPTFLVIYRDADDEVRFLEVNAVTAKLLELADDNPQGLSGRQLLESIAAEMQHPEPEVVINGGKDMLDQLLEKRIVLGTRKSKPIGE